MNYYFISHKAHQEVKEFIKDYGTVIEVTNHSFIEDNAISAHPDIQIIVINGHLIVEPNINRNIISVFKKHMLTYRLGISEINKNYLEHIQYNAVILDNYLIHNIPYTEREIIKYADEIGLKPIKVRQGYTKCSTVIVDGNSIITSDKGIAKAVKQFNIDCLLISEGNVLLEPYSYGFLGGTSGRVNNNIIFNGSLDRHPEGNLIKAFINSKGLNCVDFDKLPLADIGSIIEWKV